MILHKRHIKIRRGSSTRCVSTPGQLLKMPRPGDWPPQVVQGQLIVVPPPCLHDLAVADPPIPRVFVFSAVRDQWRDPPCPETEHAREQFLCCEAWPSGWCVFRRCDAFACLAGMQRARCRGFHTLGRLGPRCGADVVPGLRAL